MMAIDIWKTLTEEVDSANDLMLQFLGKKFISSHIDIASCLTSIITERYLCEDKRELKKLIEQHIVQVIDTSLIDLKAFYSREYASRKVVEIVLINRCFHALVIHRIAHQLWSTGNDFSAKWLNSLSARLFGIDIHPGAKVGPGMVLDHGYGIVIGETCEIGSGAFIFHNVTLGGTGHQDGDRHPKIGSDVFLGTGATILGNIKIGSGSVIAAGSLVLNEVPEGVTVAGVPAKVVGTAQPIQKVSK